MKKILIILFFISFTSFAKDKDPFHRWQPSYSDLEGSCIQDIDAAIVKFEYSIGKKNNISTLNSYIKKVVKCLESQKDDKARFSGECVFKREVLSTVLETSGIKSDFEKSVIFHYFKTSED